MTTQHNKPHFTGHDFIAWVNAGLTDGSLAVNTKKSALHIVPEGVLLVSPRIFQRFDKVHWLAAQKAFTRLRLVRSTYSKKRHIRSYLVLDAKGDSRKKRVNGFLVPNQMVPKAFPTLTDAPITPYLREEANLADAWVLWQRRIGRATYTLTRHARD